MERIASYDTTDLCWINMSLRPAVAFRDYLRIRLFSWNSNTEFIQIVGVRQLTWRAGENELIPFFLKVVTLGEV
jgi:hypothetical protein